MRTCALFSEAARLRETRGTPPRIPSRSDHFRFALYVLAGYGYEDACELLDVNPRTAERWRTELRQVASLYFGRRVTYEFAARYALDPTLRHLCEQVRGSPQQAVQIACKRPEQMKE